jgi:hypothetical protein
MQGRQWVAVIGAAIALGFSASSEAALVVNKVADAPTAWATAIAATPDTLNLPGTWLGTAPAKRDGNSSGVYRSVFDDQDVGGDNSPYIRKEYWAVGPGNGVTEATLKFAGAQDSLRFLWGSVDTYNTLKFFLNGALQGQVTDFSFVGNPAGRGAAYVNITGVTFDEVRFGSPSTNAFEFSNLSSTSAVPLPAAAWLLLSGLAGLLGIARRGRRTTA